MSSNAEQDKPATNYSSDSASIKKEMITQKESVDALLKENAGRDVLIINRDIDRSLHIDLSKKLQVDRKNDKCTLFFTTLGGDPDGAYRIARCL